MAEPSDRFDRWAASYDNSLLQHVLYQPVHRAVLRQAHRRVPDPAQVLDVGCGTGLLLNSAARTYPHAGLVGVDCATRMIDQATSRTGRPDTGADTELGFARARAEALPFHDETFDLVLSTLSLRHWRDLCRGLAEIGRVTAPAGVVIIADVLQPPARRPWTRRWLPRAAWQDDRVPLPTGLAPAIRAAGLRADHIEPIPLTVPLASITLIVARRLQHR